MAARKEILSDLNSKIADGNIREAYRTFEELPVVDQIAVSLSPGVGDAIAAYEVGEFGRRAKTNIQDQDRLGAAGNIALSALSGISLIPLFRFLRGARGVTKSATKAVDAPKKLKPPVEEPLPPAPSKDVLPEVEPFVPKPIAELGYQTGPDQPVMQSKVRKLLNEHKVGTTSLNKDLQTATPEKWVEVLQKNMPIDVHGELRLLNVLDEAGDIHPNLIKTAGPGKKISRQSLDNYIARQQRDALNIRRVPEPHQPGNLADPGMTYNETQNLYFVRGTPLESGRKLEDSHYVDTAEDIAARRGKGRGGQKIDDPKYSGQNAYVFDGAGFSDGFPIGRLGTQFDDLPADTIENITSSLREIGIGPNEKIKSVIRTQSDFTKHGPNKIRKAKETALNSAIGTFDSVAKIPRVYQEANVSIKDAISVGPNATVAGRQRTELINNLKPEFDAALRANDEQAMRKILGDDLYKTFTDTEFGTRVPGKYFAPTDESTSPFIDGQSVVSFVEDRIINSLKRKGTSEYVELTPENFLQQFPVFPYVSKLTGDTRAKINKVIKEVFERTKNVEQIKQKIFNQDPSGYLDLKQQKEIQKKLARYTKLQNKINADTAKSFKETGSTKVPTKSTDDIIELTDLRVDLDIDKFEISPKDIERITGKSFTESLPKSLDEIYYEIDPATGRQKYFDAGPNPADRAKAYLDDVSDPNSMFMNLANGVTIIKKAVNPKITKKGFTPDPYVQIRGDKVSERSNYGKLPIRARFKEAFDEGASGFHTGKAQLKKESNPDDFKVLSEQYNKNENEIAKILSELGFSKKAQKNIKTKIEGTNTIYDGTYVKFTDELKEAIAEKGIDAFKGGGPVENLSEQELAKISQSKLDEIETELKDILGFNIYDNLFKGGTLDDLYQDYDASKDIKESIIDKTEQQLRESLKIPYKDEIIDILQSDDPKADLEQRLDVFGTKQIDRALQGLNLPIDIKKTQEGIKLGKDIYAGDKFNVDFAGYKPDDGDFRGDIDFRYKDRGRFGNIDIQSTLDELGDIDTRARYKYSKGPFDVRAVKYPGRDAMGNVSYTLSDINVGRNQKIGVKTIVDQLKRVKFNLDYMYNNPKTGGFIDAGLGLSSRGSPELNIGFGREF